MRRRLLVLLSIALLAACKKKPPPLPPPPDLPTSTSGYEAICTGTKKSFTGAKKYSKDTPSKVVVFAKGLDDKHPSYDRKLIKSLDAWAAGDYKADEATLTACVDAKPMEPDFFTCSYYGASVKIHSREFQLRIIENATGNVLVDKSFKTDKRTWSCPGSVTGNADWYVDYDRQLYGELFALQPAGTTAIKETTTELYAVCSGTPVPSAGKPRTSGAAKVVYFNDDTASFSDNRPIGIDDLSADKEVANYTTVVCVTAKHDKKKQSCDFYDKTLELYDGEFEVVVREAQTAKIIETKSFKGTSGFCPDTYTFGNAAKKKWISKIDPSFKGYVEKLFANGAP